MKDAGTALAVQGAAAAGKTLVQSGRTAGMARELEAQIGARTRPGAPANSPSKTNRIAGQLQETQRQLSKQERTAAQAAAAGAALLIEDEKMRRELENK